MRETQRMSVFQQPAKFLKFIGKLPIKFKQRQWEAPESGLPSRFGLLPVI
jgi:hypothetical protein